MDSATAAPRPAIEIGSLSKTFTSGKHTHKALDNVGLKICSGQRVGLIGASGSGKSTLLRHIAGLTAGDCISKLFSEAVEAIDPRPVEGIRSTLGG
jgi:ABC-type dipeptide/oligopeptide/nickel transport system ATPase subunit